MSVSRVLASAVVLIFVCTSVFTNADPINVSGPAGRLLEMGSIKPDAIKLDVWTNKPQNVGFQTGERIIIHFKANRDCHVLALNLSKTGDISILFPNSEQPDDFVRAGQERSLFGSDSSLKLVMGKGLSEAQTVFFVSPEPIYPDLTFSDDSPVLKYGADDPGINAVLDHIHKASNLPGFNRVTLVIKGAENQRELKLMGKPKKSAPMYDSEIPETITGVPGIKGNRPEDNK